MLSNYLILCCPLLLLPLTFPSTRVFSSESALFIRLPKYWSFSFSISPSKEYSGLISFRIDWLDLFAVRGTLKSLLHCLKASVLQHSVFFMVQLPHCTHWAIVVVLSLSCVWHFITPWTAAHQASLSFIILQSLLKLMSTDWWCCPNISSSVVPFASCPQSFPASGSFPVSQLFSSGDQRFGASSSSSVLPMNIQGWFPLGLSVWSPCSPRDSQESSTSHFKSINFLTLSLLYGLTFTSMHSIGKIIA